MDRCPPVDAVLLYEGLCNQTSAPVLLPARLVRSLDLYAGGVLVPATLA